MSYNLWHNHSTAGPECASSPTSTGSGASSQVSHFLQKGCGNDAVTCLDPSHIHSRLSIPLHGDAPSDSDIAACYNPLVFDTATSDFHVQMLDLCYPEMEDGEIDVINDKNSFSMLTPPRTDSMLSLNCRAQLRTSPSSPTLFSPLEDSPESSPVLTPNSDKVEGLCLEPSSSSLVLSPYAPMPLPPIFTHESGSKVMPIPIDTSSSSLFWMAHKRNDRIEEHSEEGFQLMDFRPQLFAQVSVADAANLFTGDSIESLWRDSAPASPGPALVQEQCFALADDVDSPRDIPLEVAECQAAELRAAGTNVSLPSPFLMQFLGQPAGQTKWHCYIRGCGKQLTRKGHMLDHVRMHLDERSFVCNHCSQTFLRKADCKRHTATHNPTKGFPCSFCPKSYARKDLLTRHARICRSKSEEGDRPAKSKKQKRKKGNQKNPSDNSPDIYETSMFVIPDMAFLPHGCYESDGEYLLWGYNEANKENINPSMFPNNPMTTRMGSR